MGLDHARQPQQRCQDDRDRQAAEQVAQPLGRDVPYLVKAMLRSRFLKAIEILKREIQER